MSASLRIGDSADRRRWTQVADIRCLAAQLGNQWHFAGIGRHNDCAGQRGQGQPGRAGCGPHAICLAGVLPVASNWPARLAASSNERV